MVFRYCRFLLITVTVTISLCFILTSKDYRMLQCQPKLLFTTLNMKTEQPFLILDLNLDLDPVSLVFHREQRVSSAKLTFSSTFINTGLSQLAVNEMFNSDACGPYFSCSSRGSKWAGE